jgi:hypothetical protein
MSIMIQENRKYKIAIYQKWEIDIVQFVFKANICKMNQSLNFATDCFDIEFLAFIESHIIDKIIIHIVKFI